MKLLRKIPNLDVALAYMITDLGWSYMKIARYFNKYGFRCDRKTVKRNCDRLGIIEKPKRKGSFYNRTHKEESRIKQSEYRKNSGLSKGAKNYFYGKCGELSPVWRGGKSTRASVFYASTDWANVRFEVMRRDMFCCKVCGFTPAKTKNALNVHHIIPLSVDWGMRLVLDNLITLCKPCHIKTFGKEVELISFFQDIVRSSWRHEEVSRND